MSHVRWEVSGEDADWWAEVSVLGVGLEHSWAYSRCLLSALGLLGEFLCSLSSRPQSPSWRMGELDVSSVL